jgi:hypothetical protein
MVLRRHLAPDQDCHQTLKIEFEDQYIDKR